MAGNEPPAKKVKLPGLPNRAYMAEGLMSMREEKLSDSDAKEIADVVVGIWDKLPAEAKKDSDVLTSILDAAEAALPAAGGRRKRGGALTRSQAALRETAASGMAVLTATGAAADSAISTVITNIPKALIGAGLMSGGFTAIVSGVRDALQQLPDPVQWSTFLETSSDAIKSVVGLAGDIVPWAESPAGVMAIASFIMRYRAQQAGTTVWGVIKSDAEKVKSAAAAAGQAVETQYYSALSAYAAEKLDKKQKVGAEFMKAIEHLKPTSLARDRDAAETLASMASRMGKGGRRSGRKTKKMRRKSRRVTRRHF